MQSRDMQNCLRNLRLRLSDACSFSNDDEVQPDVEPCTVESHAFPDQPLDPVTDHAVAELLACDDSYSVVIKTICAHVHHERMVRLGVPAFVNGLELPSFSQ